MPLCCVVIVFIGCSDMNDLHNKYLKDGERIYLGRIDSVHIYPGNQRVKFRYWVSDPRVKSVLLFWVPENDSVKININKTLSTDSFDITIGGLNGLKSIQEGNYTFKIITSNDDGDYSLPFEKIINIYGETYRSTLLNRLLKTKIVKNNDLIVDWLEAESGSLFTEIKYTNTNGETVIKPISTSLVKDTLLNFPISGTFEHRTAYLPVPESLDTFYTDFVIVE